MFSDLFGRCKSKLFAAFQLTHLCISPSLYSFQALKIKNFPQCVSAHMLIFLKLICLRCMGNTNIFVHCSNLILVNNPIATVDDNIFSPGLWNALILLFHLSLSSPFSNIQVWFLCPVAANSSLMLHGAALLKTPHPMLWEIYSGLQIWLTLWNNTWYAPHNYTIWVTSNSRWSCTS